MTGTLHRFLATLLAVIVTAVFFSLNEIAAVEMDPLKGLELLRNRFAGMSDLVAEITQEKQIALLKRTMTSNGQIRFKRPDMFYMEVYPPYPSRLLLKDNVLTMVLPEDGIRQTTVLPPNEGLSHWFKLIDRPLTSLPEGINVRAEKRDESLTLSMSPKDRKGVKEISLTVIEDGQLQELVIKEQNLDRTVIRFRGLRKNVGLTADDFNIE